jgi:transketolase
LISKFDDFKITQSVFSKSEIAANMIGIAAALTIGKTHLQETSLTSLGVYDQTSSINSLLKKNLCLHAGLTLEKTVQHTKLEDIGLMKMLPGMTVINTCDYNQTKRLL